jgi:glycerate kinase
MLVLAGSFSEGLNAERVAGAIGQGLTAQGAFACDLCPLEEALNTRTENPSKPLEEVDFDRRMRAARALVIACARLEDTTLTGSIAFEAATRARQSGVPAYAVTGRNTLDPFEARIVDLQVILEADTTRALSAAGRKLAALL